MSDITATKQGAPIQVLFVCLGNICRSPTAHGILRARLIAEGLDAFVSVESAGTGTWHVGHPPDHRATAAAHVRGIDLSDLRARKVSVDDFAAFDYIIAMDHDNLADLNALAAEHVTDQRAAIHLMGDFSPAHLGQPVGDPYYGGDDGFERVLDMIEDCVEGLLNQIRKDLGQV